MRLVSGIAIGLCFALAIFIGGYIAHIARAQLVGWRGIERSRLGEFNAVATHRSEAVAQQLC